MALLRPEKKKTCPLSWSSRSTGLRSTTALGASSLDNLNTLIASKLSPTVPPDSIRLSLNRTDKLLSPSLSDSLPSLGLISGDLLFFSLAPDPQTLSPTPATILALIPFPLLLYTWPLQP